MEHLQSNDTYANPGLRFMETALYQMPAAYAEITGNPGNGEINGIVRFYPVAEGVLINAEVYGLPAGPGSGGTGIFGFHIHEGSSCSGTKDDAYANAGQHFNPEQTPHPEHAGDMPPLFGDGGNAWMLYVTDRFSIPEIIGKAIIIHSAPDDFTTQPSGNSGAKIACGTIQPA